MRKYDIIHEALETKVFNEEITLEDANNIDRLAYLKYGNLDVVTEDGKTATELLDKLSELVDDEKVILSDEDIERIQELIKSAENPKEKTEKDIAEEDDD